MRISAPVLEKSIRLNCVRFTVFIPFRQGLQYVISDVEKWLIIRTWLTVNVLISLHMQPSDDVSHLLTKVFIFENHTQIYLESITNKGK